MSSYSEGLGCKVAGIAMAFQADRRRPGTLARIGGEMD
jgi:hypothetical protein